MHHHSLHHASWPRKTSLRVGSRPLPGADGRPLAPPALGAKTALGNPYRMWAAAHNPTCPQAFRPHLERLTPARSAPYTARSRPCRGSLEGALRRFQREGSRGGQPYKSPRSRAEIPVEGAVRQGGHRVPKARRGRPARRAHVAQDRRPPYSATQAEGSHRGLRARRRPLCEAGVLPEGGGGLQADPQARSRPPRRHPEARQDVRRAGPDQ